MIGPENWRHSLNKSDLKPTLRTGHLRFPMLHPRDHWWKASREKMGKKDNRSWTTTDFIQNIIKTFRLNATMWIQESDNWSFRRVRLRSVHGERFLLAQISSSNPLLSSPFHSCQICYELAIDLVQHPFNKSFIAKSELSMLLLSPDKDITFSSKDKRSLIY